MSFQILSCFHFGRWPEIVWRNRIAFFHYSHGCTSPIINKLKRTLKQDGRETRLCRGFDFLCRILRSLRSNPPWAMALNPFSFSGFLWFAFLLPSHPSCLLTVFWFEAHLFFPSLCCFWHWSPFSLLFCFGFLPFSADSRWGSSCIAGVSSGWWYWSSVARLGVPPPHRGTSTNQALYKKWELSA